VSALGFDHETEGDGVSLRLAVGTAQGGWQVHRLSLAQGAHQMAVHPTAEHAYVPSPEGGGGPTRRVTEVRFSPDRQWLAVGGADAVIYLYDTERGYAPSQRCCGLVRVRARARVRVRARVRGSVPTRTLARALTRCCGHSSAITHLDWDVHSCVLRSNCLGHELRFWDAPSGQQIGHASACRDLEWASFGVTLGWHCQGIFLGRADGTGINGVDRSPDGTLLATVDATGGVNLHRYPCVQPEQGKPNRSSFYGHASSALACGWAGDQLLSIGGLDLCLFQWERVEPSPDRPPRR